MENCGRRLKNREIELTLSLTPECLLKASARDRESGPLGEVSLLAHEALEAAQSSPEENFQGLDILDTPEQPPDEKKPSLLKWLVSKEDQ